MKPRIIGIGVVIVGLCMALGAVQLHGVPLDHNRRTPVVEVVEKISPSVVTIRTDVRKKVLVDPFGFRNFFGGNQGFVAEQNFTSAGSGVIVDSQGVVITNAHVIADANRLTCITYDGEERSLTLIGVDNDFDIAVLQIDRGKDEPGVTFPEIDWGTTSDLMMGETLVAIGSALSFSNSVSVGVVSAIERTIEVPGRPEPYFGMIQTDAAINRGNSGGPLVNIRGELIGVTTLIATEGGGSDGIGFAIPVERVANVYREYVQGVVSLEERLGIMMVNPQVVEGIHASQMERLGLVSPKVEGIVIVKLYPEGLAAQSGVREGDLLLAVNGKQVPNRTELQRALEEHPAGRMLGLSILRVNQQTGEVERKEIEIPTGDLMNQEMIEKIDSWLGFDVTGIGNDYADQTGVAIDDGVVVKSVSAGSPSQRAGLQPGDLIQGIDKWRIQTIGDFRRIRHIARNWENVDLQVRRGNSVGKLPIAVGNTGNRGARQGL
jgi:serine protease Do